MGLTNLINANQRNTVSDDNGPWRQFILDHLDYIRDRSTTFTIDPKVMNLYRYDLKRFLKEYEKISRREDIAWIVLLLNDLPNDFEFEAGGDYIIPSDDVITKLFSTYVTISANSK